MSNQKIYTNISVRGDNILFRGYENGRRIHEKIPFRPTLFVPTKKKTNYKTLFGEPVEPFQPGSIGDCREFIDQYSDVKGFSIYGNTDYTYQFISETFPNEMEYDSDDLRVAYFDIETKCEEGFPDVSTANEEVIAITIRIGTKVCTFALGKFKELNSEHDARCYSSESRMLEDFLEYWKQLDIDIITGWNVNFFDIPYLINRIERVLGEGESKRLSPWNHIKERIVTVMQRDHTVYDLVGISTLDYFDLYRKLTFVNRESYKLDHIAYVELGERKTSYSEYESISDFYTKNFQKFIEYNVKDVDLVVRLEEKLRLMELALRIAYSAKVNHNDIFSQVRTWDQIIYHHLNSLNIVIPMKKSGEKDDKFEGAYVKEPDVGMHKWVVSFDLDSLYPHLIMQYNISPETLTVDGKRGTISPDGVLTNGQVTNTFLQEYKAKNLSIAANGTTYSKKKQGFLPHLMHTLYEERKIYKKKMLECKAQLKTLPETASNEEKTHLKKQIAKYHNFQLARKIQLNSAFGAIGNQYFRYYNLDMAEAITISGQLSIRWIEKYLNEYMNQTVGTKDENYVIASDTDSIYLRMDTLVTTVLPNETNNEKIIKFLLNACDKAVQPFIDKKYNELAVIMNAFDQKMNMKREAIADKGIWTAKKRYMLNVIVGEDGVVLKKPEQKIMGIETARSSTPEIVRNALADCIEIILNGNEEQLIKYTDAFKTKFNKSPVEDIAFPRGCNGMDKYSDSTNIYRKSTPIAVKGSLLYNHFIRKNNLQKKYSLVRDGEKIKFVYLKEPNPFGAGVASFPGKLPKEFDLDRFIDFNKQFEVSFVEPLKTILDAIGWRIEKEQTLESLFA
jgi:DNA polymerase elongation subunit (family B)